LSHSAPVGSQPSQSVSTAGYPRLATAVSTGALGSRTFRQQYSRDPRAHVVKCAHRPDPVVDQCRGRSAGAEARLAARPDGPHAMAAHMSDSARLDPAGMRTLFTGRTPAAAEDRDLCATVASADQNSSSTMEGHNSRWQRCGLPSAHAVGMVSASWQRRGLGCRRDRSVRSFGALLVNRLGPHGGHAATERNRRQSRQSPSDVQEIWDIQRQ
jgi:hypothetical protein